MIEPVECVNFEVRIVHICWHSVEEILVQVTSIVVDN